MILINIGKKPKMLAGSTNYWSGIIYFRQMGKKESMNVLNLYPLSGGATKASASNILKYIDITI